MTRFKPLDKRNSKGYRRISYLAEPFAAVWKVALQRFLPGMYSSVDSYKRSDLALLPIETKGSLKLVL
jgi:hypothetical protein